MNILIDTDILLSIESDQMIQRHLQEVVRFINDYNYRIVIHPLTVKEIENDPDIPNKIILLSKIKKYSQLETRSTPYDDDNFFRVTGKPASERDKVDAFLLYCLYKNQVDILLTEDPDVIKNAAKLNISDTRIMDIKRAFNHFKSITEKKIKRGNAPEYCFYQDGDIWHIGEKDATGTFKDMKGFHYMRILLDKVHREISCLELYNAVSGSYVGEQTEKFNEDEEFLYKLHKEHGSSPESLQYVKEHLNTLREKLKDPDSLSIEDKDNKKEEARKIEKYLRAQERPSKDMDPNVGKARLGVRNAIVRALKNIREKSTSSFSNHLKATIETGHSCQYNPPVNDQPSWKLHPEA